jgi:hypothetical protein
MLPVVVMDPLQGVGRVRHVDQHSAMKLTLEYEQEVDGRWIAEVPEIPGDLAYGSTPSEAMARAVT